MKLKYLDKEYECVSVGKEANKITIHTGVIEDDEEIIYQIFGDIDFDAVQLEGGTWTEKRTDADRIKELEEALELLLNGVTE